MTTKPDDISLSVIVPCYNVEPYLDMSLQCLDRQWNGRTDYEIIFVNDASTDGTIGRLEAYREKHPETVIVIDKQVNEGVSAARNSALEIARGKWVVFFDPDDVLVDCGYGRLLALTESEEFDVLSFGVRLIEDGAPIGSLSIPEEVNIDWRGSSLDFMQKYSFGTCWSYFIKRELLADKRFSGLSICEDTVFNLSYLLGNRKMVRTDSKIYYYIVRPSSATNTVDAVRLSRHCDDILTAIKVLEDFKQGQDESVQNRIKRHQRIFSHNLLTRLLLSNQTVSDIKIKVDALTRLSLFPIPGGKTAQMLNVVFKHTGLLSLLRPFYRLYRKNYYK